MLAGTLHISRDGCYLPELVKAAARPENPEFKLSTSLHSKVSLPSKRSIFTKQSDPCMFAHGAVTFCDIVRLLGMVQLPAKKANDIKLEAAPQEELLDQYHSYSLVEDSMNSKVDEQSLGLCIMRAFAAIA